MAKSYRDQSKTNYASDEANIDRINCGSFQRIADAMEIMAKDRAQLERDLTWYKEQYASRGRTIKNLESQIKGLKIAKSRFKNQLDSKRESEAVNE